MGLRYVKTQGLVCCYIFASHSWEGGSQYTFFKHVSGPSGISACNLHFVQCSLLLLLLLLARAQNTWCKGQRACWRHCECRPLRSPAPHHGEGEGNITMLCDERRNHGTRLLPSSSTSVLRSIPRSVAVSRQPHGKEDSPSSVKVALHIGSSAASSARTTAWHLSRPPQRHRPPTVVRTASGSLCSDHRRLHSTIALFQTSRHRRLNDRGDRRT